MITIPATKDWQIVNHVAPGKDLGKFAFPGWSRFRKIIHSRSRRQI